MINMNVVRDIGSSNAVAPDTMGTFVIGSYEWSYGYTPAVGVEYSRITKFFPRQHVSAFESHSFRAGVLGGGC